MQFKKDVAGDRDTHQVLQNVRLLLVAHWFVNATDVYWAGAGDHKLEQPANHALGAMRAPLLSLAEFPRHVLWHIQALVEIRGERLCLSFEVIRMPLL